MSHMITITRTPPYRGTTNTHTWSSQGTHIQTVSVSAWYPSQLELIFLRGMVSSQPLLFIYRCGT